MSLLIDGYNVLYATGILPGGSSLGKHLEAARRALVHFVAARVPPEELTRTTIVFDSHAPPFGLPRVTQQFGITIRYAVDYEDADELIAELIRTDSAPRRLTVVSSDHSVQRAARRRRARAVSSEQWYSEMRRPAPASEQPQQDVKPELPLAPGEVQRWLEEFKLEPAPPAVPTDAAGDDARPAKPPRLKPSEPQADEIGNPFPPGYGEDLEEKM